MFWTEFRWRRVHGENRCATSDGGGSGVDDQRSNERATVPAIPFNRALCRRRRTRRRGARGTYNIFFFRSRSDFSSHRRVHNSKTWTRRRIPNPGPSGSSIPRARLPVTTTTTDDVITYQLDIIIIHQYVRTH